MSKIVSHEGAASSVLDLCGLIMGNARDAIAIAKAQGKRLPVTKLAESLAEQTGIDKVFCYHVVSKYIAARGNLRIKNGPNGGIEEIPAEELEKENV